MGQPIWITPAGSLGTVASNAQFSIQLQAVGENNVAITYALNGGSFPVGSFTLTNSGLLQGTAGSVNSNTTSEFTIRVTDVNGNIRDRTFSLTVLSIGAPQFITPSGSLANVEDSTWLNIPIQYTQPDSTIPIVINVTDGVLPPGIEINEKGVIRGYPLPPVTDLSGLPTIKTYAFVLTITSSLGTADRLYSITVRNQRLTNPPNTRAPTILNNQPLTFNLNDSDPYFGYYIDGSSIGTYNSGDDFIFKIIGYDFDGNALNYQFSNLPPGLTGDVNTGWITGIPELSTTGISTYEFNVRCYKKTNPSITSGLLTFFVTISRGVSPVILWLTPSNLGTIYNGLPCELFVKAVADLPLSYRLTTGFLPPNTNLLDTGEIAGRVAEIPFAETGNSTVVATSIGYDSVAYDIVEYDATTYTNANYGNSFTFTVEAYNPQFPTVKSQKQFTISISEEFPKAFESIYIKAMPSFNDRAIINSLLTNNTLIPDDWLYRKDDSFFGKASNVIYQHAYGIYASSLPQYLESVTKNHYNKRITLGELKTAVAKDDSGNIIYEVVYSEIIDDLVNTQGTSIQKEINWPTQITLPNDNYYVSSTVIFTSYGYDIKGNPVYYTSLDPNPVQVLYPNSLVNMRQQVASVIGQDYNYKLLPRWMTSQQRDGNTLGFTQAWVICYTKPGYSETIKDKINTQWPYKLNQVNFGIDRFEVNKSATYNYNVKTKSWTSLPSATHEPNPIDSKYFYLLFPQKTILPNTA